MSIFKRGQTYWFNFVFEGQHIQQSTKQGNPRVARQVEAAYRTALAKHEVGITERKAAAPTLARFIEDRFTPWVRAQFEQASPKAWKNWYRIQLKNILGYAPLASRKLDAITGEQAADYAAYLQARGLKPASVNASLRALRRCLKIAAEWGIITAAPKVKLLRGEAHRERVVTPEEEQRYLAAATPLLADIATVLVDSGMRPEECFRLRWESVAWNHPQAPYGTLQVTHGKTAAARRMIPLSPRVRAILERHWQHGGHPMVGWVWPAATRSGHMEPSTVRKHHDEALEASGVTPFVLYTLRHTFLTRLGESGCDVWTLARIAGHSTIAMSARYVHPGTGAVLNMFTRMLPAKELPAGTDEPEKPVAVQ